MLLDNEIVFNEAIIEEREQGIQEIQQQIGEVNEIFKDLAVLVNDQGTLIGEFTILSLLSLFSVCLMDFHSAIQSSLEFFSVKQTNVIGFFP